MTTTIAGAERRHRRRIAAAAAAVFVTCATVPQVEPPTAARFAGRVNVYPIHSAHSRSVRRSIVALAVSGLLTAAAAAPAGDMPWVTRRGDQLVSGDHVVRYISVDSPDALQIITDYRFDGDGPEARYRLPNEFEQRDALATVQQMGGRVMRAFVITCHPQPDRYFMYAVGGDHVVPNDEALRVVDRLLQLCHEYNVRVIIPLVAYHSAIRGDVSSYGPDFWKVGSAANAKFKEMLANLLQRKNAFTGVRYADDPAVLGWQTGNELVMGDDPDRRAWLHDIAAYIKKLDPHHLLIDGRNRPADVYGKYDEFFADRNIDALSYHTYVNLPQANTPVATLRLMRAQFRGKLPLLVTEVAMTTPPATLRALFDEVVADGTVGAGFWAMRFHNRDGGFYKHSDRGSEFEDLNWPGFADVTGVLPAVNREHELLDIIAEYAAKIQGEPAAAAPKPAAPKMLPAADSGHLSWQGSTGARTYTIERATSAHGPWQTVTAGFSDNLVVNAPLYCDATAEAGRSYFYRVLAANDAGSSPASNVVGPVVNHSRWLVDELFDLKQTASTENVRIDAAYAHSAYLEDVAVLRRADQAKAAQVVYTVSAPLTAATVRVFEASPAPTFRVRDANGSWQPVTPKVAQHGDGSRATFQLDLAGKDTRSLEIELPANAPAGQAIGRIEIAYEAR